MKKMLFVTCIICLCVGLTGCGNEENKESLSTLKKEEMSVVTEIVDSVNNTDTSIEIHQEITEERNKTVADTSSESLSTSTFTIEDVEFKMILVEAGTFIMGSDNTDVAFSESPAHQVTLSKNYLIGETEVTEALWNAVMNGTSGDDTMPKTSVTWNDAQEFVSELNKLAHKQGVITDNQNFCLPTEAEWEFAAKGGNESKGYLYSGSNNIDDVAQTLENTGSNSPVAVKGKQPNELGIYDMSGNAYEWVNDYGSEYSGDAQTDPQNTINSGTYVKRGGSNYHAYENEPYLFTTTGRYFYGSTDWTIGFRIALK